MLDKVHIIGVSNAREPKPSRLADASNGREPIGHGDGEGWPNTRAARPTFHSKPNTLESTRAEGKVPELRPLPSWAVALQSSPQEVVAGQPLEGGVEVKVGEQRCTR